MRTRLFVPAAALVLAFGLSACGGDSDDSGDALPTAPSQPASSAPAAPPAGGGGAPTSGTSGGTGGGNSLHDKMVKVAQCLRDRGYDAEDPPGDSVFIMTKNVKDQDAANKDLKECRARNGVEDGPGGG